MTKTLALPRAFTPANASKTVRSRLSLYESWLQETRRDWRDPDLVAYRDFLLSERRLADRTVANYLATVRQRYRALLRANSLRDQLYDATPHEAAPADRKAFVDEALTRIANATHPEAAPVVVVEERDVADEQHLRLTVEQANRLLDMPEAAHGEGSLRALRDSAIIAVLLCTGLREAELCNLLVSDLRLHVDGHLALRVRRGKGAVQRLIPYGDLDWCLAFVEDWLTAAGIAEGAVFRGFYKGYAKVRPSRLNESSVQRLLADYPLDADLWARPHDLRRTYARRLYEAGMKVEQIQANLGHEDAATTWRYIGDVAMADRLPPPDVYRAR